MAKKQDQPAHYRKLTQEQVNELAEVFLILEKWQYELDLSKNLIDPPGPDLAETFACEGELSMKSFRTLDLSVEFYELSEKSDVKGNLRDQLLRASSSISLNLSEGNAKRTMPEKKRYYQTAYASAQECKTILKLAKVQDKEVLDTADKLGAWIFNLLKSEIPTLKF